MIFLIILKLTVASRLHPPVTGGDRLVEGCDPKCVSRVGASQSRVLNQAEGEYYTEEVLWIPDVLIATVKMIHTKRVSPDQHVALDFPLDYVSMCVTFTDIANITRYESFILFYFTCSRSQFYTSYFLHFYSCFCWCTPSVLYEKNVPTTTLGWPLMWFCWALLWLETHYFYANHYWGTVYK